LEESNQAWSDCFEIEKCYGSWIRRSPSEEDHCLKVHEHESQEQAHLQLLQKQNKVFRKRRIKKLPQKLENAIENVSPSHTPPSPTGGEKLTDNRACLSMAKLNSGERAKTQMILSAFESKKSNDAHKLLSVLDETICSPLSVHG
jgi:hypothetical protein